MIDGSSGSRGSGEPSTGGNLPRLAPRRGAVGVHPGQSGDPWAGRQGSSADGLVRGAEPGVRHRHTRFDGERHGQVRNDGSVVDVFAVDVVGEAAGWASVDPPSVNLYPGAQGTAEVRFMPPRSTAVTAGSKVFGVRVRSQEDPGFSVVEEGVVDVEPFTELGATVVPPTVESSGSPGPGSAS